MANFLRKTTLFRLLAATWLALAVIFAGVFVIVEHHHEHVNAHGISVPTSENCQICISIQIAIRFIEAFGRLGIYLAIIAAIVYHLSSEKLQRIFSPFNATTLKVRFNC